VLGVAVLVDLVRTLGWQLSRQWWWLLDAGDGGSVDPAAILPHGDATQASCDGVHRLVGGPSRSWSTHKSQSRLIIGYSVNEEIGWMFIGTSGSRGVPGVAAPRRAPSSSGALERYVHSGTDTQRVLAPVLVVGVFLGRCP
jgi:hypothetical protein